MIYIVKSNIIFKGESAENTTIISNETWFYGQVDSTHYGFSRNNLFNITQSTNIGFDDLKFQTIAYTTVSTLTEDTAYDGMLIDFDESSSCWVSGCRFEKAQRHVIHIDNSDHVEVRGCYINDAWSHGGGGGNGFCYFFYINHL